MESRKEIKWKGASVKLFNRLILKMEMSNLTYKQQIDRVNQLISILHLNLRKRPNENIWEMRIGGRWIQHTSIAFYE